MGGLNRICKMYGGMEVNIKGKTKHYKWDYAKDEAVDESELVVGSDAWKASEKAKWSAFADEKLEQPTKADNER